MEGDCERVFHNEIFHTHEDGHRIICEGNCELRLFFKRIGHKKSSRYRLIQTESGGNFSLDFCSTQCYNDYVEQKGGAYLADKKLGRPTDNPKPVRMGIRIDADTVEKLDEYCKKNNLLRSEAVRIAINWLIGQK